MARKVKLTRPELKRRRDALKRFKRYLPMLKLKQQQLQIMLRDVARTMREVQQKVDRARETFNRYRAVTHEIAGVDVAGLAEPSEVKTDTSNVAGVRIPVFRDIAFPAATYSLFGTPAWVDRAIADLRTWNRAQAERDVLKQQHDLLNHELTRIIQRVNLFEKIKIPEAEEAIRLIRIRLGDEMTNAVGRAKIAKEKIRQRDAGTADSLTPAHADTGEANGNGADDNGEGAS